MYLAAQIQANLGSVNFQQGHLTEAEDCWRTALEIFSSLGVLFDKIGLLNNLGGLAAEKGEHNVAEGYFQESLALARDLGDQRGIIEALTNLAVVFTQTHQWSAAADCYRQALQFDTGAVVQKRLWQSLARVHTLMAIDWLQQANQGQVSWLVAIRHFLSELFHSIIYLIRVAQSRVVSKVKQYTQIIPCKFF